MTSDAVTPDAVTHDAVTTDATTSDATTTDAVTTDAVTTAPIAARRPRAGRRPAGSRLVAHRGVRAPLLALALAALAVQGASPAAADVAPLPTPAPSPAPLPAPPLPPVLPDVPTGPDVSRWQHPGGRAIDWAAVRGAGTTFTIIKATEGSTYVNPWFGGDRDGATAAGLAVGGYHYARPAMPVSTAVDQARAFAATLGPLTAPGTLPPVLDIETSGGLTPGQLVTWSQTFLETLQQRTGRVPVVYTYPSFWKVQMADSAAFTRYPLWLAAYRSTPPAPVGGWSAWSIWQHTASARLPGISGDVDMNRFAGDQTAFAAFADGTLAEPVVVVAPAAPVSVRAVAGPRSAAVRWVPSDDGGAVPTSYTVTVSPGGRTVTVPGSATSATVTGLAPGGTAAFAVTATNVAGTSASSRASAAVTVLGDVPAAPTSVVAVPGRGSVSLAWRAGTGPTAPTSYTVSRCSPAPCTPATVVARVAASSAPSYVDTGLLGGVGHAYAVTAATSWGESRPAAAVAAVPQPVVDVLPAPAAPTVTAGSGRLTVRWAPVRYAASYQVRRCTTPQCLPGGASVATLPSTVTRWTQQVPAGATYTYAVTAVAGPVVSPLGAPGRGTSLIPQALRVTAVPAVPTPGQPVTLTVRLSRADTRAALAGRRVTLALTPARGARPAPLTLTTSATGVASAVVRTEVNASVAVSSTATDLLKAVTRRTVQVKPVLTGVLSAAAAPRTAKVYLTGRTSAAYAGERVFRQVLVRGTWRIAASAPVSRSGTYRLTVPAATAAGSTRMRVLIGRTARHRTGYSPAVVLTRS